MNGDQDDERIQDATVPQADSRKRPAEDDGGRKTIRPTFVSDSVPARLGTRKRQAEDEGDQDEARIKVADTPMQAIEMMEDRVPCVSTLKGDLPMIICEEQIDISFLDSSASESMGRANSSSMRRAITSGKVDGCASGYSRRAGRERS